MLRFEMKKIFLKRVNQIVLLVLLFIVLVGSFVTIRDVRGYREDGTEISGLSAARQLRKEKKQMARRTYRRSDSTGSGRKSVYHFLSQIRGSYACPTAKFG